MFLRELFEAKARKIVAVMPGGFHPFHPGHKSLYDWAVKTFGQPNVYVAATNDTATRPFPFEVKKKLAAMAGVPESNFIQVKSPFNNREYASLLDADTALVFVRSQKDKNEQPLPDQTKKNGEPGYLRSYTSKDLNTADEMGYMAYGPTINFDFSGMQIKSASELRATWPEMSDEDKLKAAKLMYGNGAPVAVKLLNKALGNTVGEDVSPENEKKFHNELDDLVHKYFGDSPDEEKMKKKYRKTSEDGKGWDDKRRLKMYNPDGDMYMGKSMPGKGKRLPDPVDKAQGLDALPDEPYEFDFDKIDKERLKKTVASLVDNLPIEKDKKVVQAYFGLGNFDRSYTFDEIGKAMGVSKDRVRQRLQRALRQLRHPSRSRELRAFMDDVNESDLVLDKVTLRSYIKDMVADYLDREDDVEKLARVLKLLVGKEVKARGNRYTITSEDIIEVCSSIKRKRRG